MLLTINDTDYDINDPSCRAIVDGGKPATQFSFSTTDKRLIRILSIYFKDEMVFNDGEFVGVFEFDSYSNRRYNFKSYDCTMRL